MGSFEFRTVVHVDMEFVWNDTEVFYLTTFFSYQDCIMLVIFELNIMENWCNDGDRREIRGRR